MLTCVSYTSCDSTFRVPLHTCRTLHHPQASLAECPVSLISLQTYIQNPLSWALSPLQAPPRHTCRNTPPPHCTVQVGAQATHANLTTVCAVPSPQWSTKWCASSENNTAISCTGFSPVSPPPLSPSWYRNNSPSSPYALRPTPPASSSTAHSLPLNT